MDGTTIVMAILGVATTLLGLTTTVLGWSLKQLWTSVGKRLGDIEVELRKLAEQEIRRQAHEATAKEQMSAVVQTFLSELREHSRQESERLDGWMKRLGYKEVLVLDRDPSGLHRVQSEAP